MIIFDRKRFQKSNRLEQNFSVENVQLREQRPIPADIIYFVIYYFIIYFVSFVQPYHITFHAMFGHSVTFYRRLLII